MKKLLVFVILYLFRCLLWTFVLLCPSTKAQWEGAQVQRLTYNTSVNKMVGWCIDKNDKLFLFYRQWWWDPYQQPYRDTLFLMTKEKGGEWSPPERISNPFQELCCGKYVGYDPYTGLIHLFYDCCDSIYSRSLYYTNSNIPNWEVVKTDSGPRQVHPRNMAFDTLGNIHFAWTVDFDSIGQNWYRVLYANNSMGEWVKQQVSPPIWLGGMRCENCISFDVQKNGATHIVYYGEPYCDLECQAFYVRNDSLNSTNWITDTVPKPARPLYQYGVGWLKVDTHEKVHLVTGGCTVEYCGPWPGHWRTFYYYNQPEDSIWQGPELILDSLMYIRAIFLDRESVPSVAEWDPFTYCRFFSDRKQGFWREPYQILDSSSVCNDPSSIYPQDFYFVFDSEGRGHGAFTGSVFLFMGQDDSLEIFYYGAPLSAVEDTLADESKFGFKLFQNYPNPFNQNTVICYSLNVARPVPTTLILYNILGKEVRELVNIKQSSGSYTIFWDGKDNRGKEVASGIYFYQLKAGVYKQTRKLVLIK